MYLVVAERLKQALRRAVHDRYGEELMQVAAEAPPRPALGDIAFPVALGGARGRCRGPGGDHHLRCRGFRRALRRLPATNALALSVSASSGLITGTFTHPDTGKKSNVKGVVLQQPGSLFGAGFFLSTNLSGLFLYQ